MDFKNIDKAPSPPINEMAQSGTIQNEKAWNTLLYTGIAILAGVGIWILIEANQKPSRNRSKSGMPYSEAEEEKMASDREYI